MIDLADILNQEQHKITKAVLSLKKLKTSLNRKRKQPPVPTRRSQCLMASSFSLDLSEKRKKSKEPKIIDLTEIPEPEQGPLGSEEIPSDS